MFTQEEQEVVLPLTGVETIELLNKVFPEQSAQLSWTEKEIWHKAGQRSVVNWLIELRKRADDNEED
jgi:hypothetical protein